MHTDSFHVPLPGEVDKYNSTHKMSEVVVAALDAYLTKEGY
jgi:hypothetical protein